MSPVKKTVKRKTMAAAGRVASEVALQDSVDKLTSQLGAFNAQLNGIRLVMTKILKRLPE